jgi:hypothetical protein
MNLIDFGTTQFDAANLYNPADGSPCGLLHTQATAGRPALCRNSRQAGFMPQQPAGWFYAAITGRLTLCQTTAGIFCKTAFRQAGTMLSYTT